MAQTEHVPDFAKDPEPPPAPLTRTRCPGCIRAVPCNAMAPACGMVEVIDATLANPPARREHRAA
mgnify:CR=1 FL=1